MVALETADLAALTTAQLRVLSAPQLDALGSAQFAALTSKQVAVSNDYDNAVLYNDFVVSSLIRMLAAARLNSLLVYFSDHGEDVYDSTGHQVLGRREGKPTLPMYAIPFIVWNSEQWRAAHPRTYPREVLDRRYSTSHFIHTWSDLVGLRFDDFDASKSLISRDFKERALLVGSPAQPGSLIDLRSMMHRPATR